MNTEIKINNAEGINKVLNKVNFVLKTDKKSLNNFIKEKVLATLDRVMQENLIGGTTNDDVIYKYVESNHIQDLPNGNGFIIYNNASIPADYYNQRNFDKSKYPNGEFSLALAFEYGVGLVGENTVNPNAWKYNINNYNFGWYLPVSVYDKKGVQTAGYVGFEIYRKLKVEVESKLASWVREYFKEVEK